MEAHSPVKSSLLLRHDYYASVDQTQINQSLAEAVLERFNAVSGLRQNLADEVIALRSASEKAVQFASDGLRMFLTEIGPAKPQTMSPEELRRSAGCSIDFFDKLSMSANERAQQAFDSLFQRALHQQTEVDADAEGPMTIRDHSPPLGAVGFALPPVLAELHSAKPSLARRDDLKRELRGWKDELLPFGDHDTVQGTIALCDFELADPLRVLRSELQKSTSAVAALDSVIRREMEERTAALRANEVHTAESISMKLSTHHVEMLELVRKRIRATTDAASDVDEFQGEVAQQRDVLERLERLRQESADLSKACVGERERLARWYESVVKRAAQDRADYTDACDSRAKEIQLVTEDEAAVWAELTRLLSRLQVLHSHRDEVVEAHLRAAEAEKNREALVTAQKLAFREHAAKLDALNSMLRSADDFIRLLNESCEGSFTAIERKAWPQVHTEMVVKECVRYHDAYLHFVGFTGDIVHRTEQRIANISRLLRSVDFQVKAAPDTLDSDLPVYREQQQHYAATLRSLEDRLRGYQRVEAQEGELWRPVEQCLEENNIEFTPPELVLQELRRDLAQAHVEAVDSLTNEEQTLLDKEKRAARGIAYLVEATKASVDEKRRSAQHNAQLMTPTKSDV